MEIERRDFLAGVIGIGLAGLTGSVGSNVHTGDLNTRWHPLTRSLLRRARRVSQQLDRGRIERIVHEVSEVPGRPVIKWMDCAQSAFKHLSRYSVDELSQMPIARLWPAPPRFPDHDDDAVEPSVELCVVARRLVGAGGGG